MNVEVTKDEVRILEGSDLPNENEYKITTCYFTFDEFTSSFQVKRAIFTILSTGEMYETDIINDECDIPVEVLKKEYERVKIGVYGYNIGENEELLNRFSPSYDEFIVPTGSYEEGALSPESITPSQYDLYSQALQQGLSEVDDKLDEVVETVDNKLQEVDDTVSQKINEMDQKIDETDEAITRAEKLDIDISKVENKTTITITKQDGSTKSEDILDGEDGTDGENGIGLQYDWSGTSLGVKREDEALFTYVNLEGKKGDPGAINLLIVNELPLVGSEDTLYFVPKTDTEESDMYDEYVWINNDWELVGTKQITVDLTNYYTKTEVNNLIPTKLSQLSSDVTHRVVTDSEKTTWNNKSDFSGSYNDLSNKPTIPTKLSQLSDDSAHRLVSDTEKTTWNSKQSLLVSGTNIKTINNQSILGSGNITIEGGGTVNTYYLVNILNMTSTSDATYEIVNDLINNNQFVIFDDPDGRSRELFCYVPIKTFYQRDLDMQTFWYIDNQDKYNLVVIAHSGTSVTVIRTTYHSIEEAYNLADGKQNALVSGTNIKTINNQSLLGSGNITIEGGGSGTVDTAMSDSSTNAVQNKVIKGYVDNIVGDIGTILDNINGEVIGG